MPASISYSFPSMTAVRSLPLHVPRRLTHGKKVPTDPHRKRVAKERAKKKAVKKHKQQMRRQGK